MLPRFSWPLLALCTFFAPTAALATESASPVAASEVTPADANPGAAAPEADVHKQAKELFERGLQAYEAGDVDGCAEQMMAAFTLMPHHAFAFNIGLVREEQGNTARALEWYREALWLSPPEEERAPLLDKIKKLEAQLASRGLQQLTVRSEPPGAKTLLDGAEIGTTPVTVELAPGGHRVQLLLDGYDEQSVRFELPTQRAVLVERTLSRTSAPPATPVEPRTDAAPRPASQTQARVTPAQSTALSGQKLTALVLAAAGGAALIGSGFLELERQDAESTAAVAPQRDYHSEFDRMTTYQSAARITAGAGLALLLGAGVLWLTGNDEAAPPQSSGIRLGCREAEICVSFGGRY